MPDLERLAELVRIKNNADAAIAELIGRPAAPGNIGEFVAGRVFAIQLVASGSHPGHDGVFTAGPLAGKTVNIKKLQPPRVHPGHQPSPVRLLPRPHRPGRAGTSAALGHRLSFLFERDELMATLAARGVKIDVATSVRKTDWERARIFPPRQAPPLLLSQSQLAQLALFSPHATKH